jgi:hypothetical protein
MLMPNKITKPIDSLIAISGYILSIIGNRSMYLDEVRSILNREYPINIPIEKVILSLDFLYLMDKIEINDNEIKIK